MVTDCPADIVWPSLSGCWTQQRCWAVGPHDVHTDSNGVPLCTEDEAAFMRDQHRLCTDGLRRSWPGAVSTTS